MSQDDIIKKSNGKIYFSCPHCEEKHDDDSVIDIQYFSSERIQDSDDLNADPTDNIDTLMQLWYCLWCGQYFRVYYKLDKITKLKEDS